MHIIILHGEDTTKSYARLTKFINSAKKRGWEIINDEIPNTPSLFGAERLIIFRDYKLLTKPDIKNLDRFDDTLVIYHTTDLPATFLKSLPKDIKTEKFDVPKILFSFLENIYPGNTKTCLKMLHQIVETEAVELVFFFIARQFRDLYWVKIDPSTTGFPDWKLNKLKSQANKFKPGQIENIIFQLSEIDIKVKSSEANLLSELDLLIIKELE